MKYNVTLFKQPKNGHDWCAKMVLCESAGLVKTERAIFETLCRWLRVSGKEAVEWMINEPDFDVMKFESKEHIYYLEVKRFMS